MPRALLILAILLAGGGSALVARATEVAALPATEAARPSFFGSVEIKRGNLKPFPKWTGMLDRYFEEKTRGAPNCQVTRYNPCHYREWQDFLKSQKGQPLLEQLRAVNAFLNRARYITDLINWGIDDYWATPNEFFQKDGDCEDYAIAKLMTLRSLGRGDVDMRIAVVQDLNLRLAHAVLVVRTGGKTYVLDNQIPQLVEEQTIHHYRAIYSVSEQSWWLHRRP